MSFQDLVNDILSFMDNLVPAIFALALIVIVWRVVEYTYKSNSSQGRQSARSYFLYAAIGIIIMTSLWGFVNLILNIIDFPTV